MGKFMHSFRISPEFLAHLVLGFEPVEERLHASQFRVVALAAGDVRDGGVGDAALPADGRPVALEFLQAGLD